MQIPDDIVRGRAGTRRAARRDGARAPLPCLAHTSCAKPSACSRLAAWSMPGRIAAPSWRLPRPAPGASACSRRCSELEVLCAGFAAEAHDQGGARGAADDPPFAAAGPSCAAGDPAALPRDSTSNSTPPIYAGSRTMPTWRGSRPRPARASRPSAGRSSARSGDLAQIAQPSTSASWRRSSEA